MKNEILEELWKVKDQVANEYGYNIEKEAKATVVDLTRQVKSTTKES